MTTMGLNGVVGRLRRVSATQIGAGRTDGALLADFVDLGDTAAIDALVRRHGPMVLGVCRRVLGSRQDAEDAFQAVFLVLVRKASSIVPKDMVGNWLYGVAHHTAVRVRAQNFKRHHRERQMPTMPEPETATEQSWNDLRPVLDEELSRLPDRYRAVIVLCDVEGRTRKDAARHLKCPEGSVSSRLARARTMLSKRLARRGIALSGSAMSGLIAEHAVASIPHELLDSTIQFASATLAGTSADAGVLALSQATTQVPLKVSLIAKGVLGAMAIKKTIALGVLVTAFVLGSTTCGVVALRLQGGQESGGETPKSDVAKRESPPKEEISPEELVKQLNADEFPKREAAEKSLISLGAKALPAVRLGSKSSEPEIAQRCERLLPKLLQAELVSFTKAFKADVERKAGFDHPIWKRYVAMVGDSKPSRELFAAILKNEDWMRQLDAAEADPAKAGDIYRDAIRQIGAHTMSNLLVSFLIPIWPCDQPEDVAYVMLLGSYKKTDPAYPLSERDMPSRQFVEGESRIHFGRGLGLAFQGKRLAIDPKKGDRSIVVDDGGGDAVQSGRVMLLLLGHWLEQRNCWPVIAEHLKSLSAVQEKQLLPFARRAIADKNAPMLCRAAWISLLRRFGDKSDADLLVPLFKDTSGMDWPNTSRYGEPGGNLINQAQVREVAIGSAIFLRGRDPRDFGFTCLINQTPAKKREDDIHSTLFPVLELGTGEKKEVVLAKAIAWLAAAAKPIAPKKLGRVADPPSELAQELARLDTVYRQGSAEKYVEFEAIAAELCKKYPQPENQARIWFHVAHVGAQGGINKHVELVRKYGQKMLEISQDPLERGTMYSYLASTCDVDSAIKTFAEKRRLGAEHLLTGYAEMLAQELPEKAPERPALGPVRDGFEEQDPNKRGEAIARARAMQEAYNQARFVEDLIFRRDTLVLQLRGQYRPTLHTFEHTAEGVEELRALATKKLKNAAVVEALLAKIVGPDRPDAPKESGEPQWTVEQARDNLVKIAVGSRQGLKIGDVLELHRADPKAALVGKIRIVALDYSEAIGQLTEKTEHKVQKGDVLSRPLPPEFGGFITTREDLKGYRIVTSQKGLDLIVKAWNIKDPPKIDFDAYLLVVGFRLAGTPNMAFDLDAKGNLEIRYVPHGPRGIFSDRVHYKVKGVKREGVKTAFGKPLADVDVESMLGAAKE